MANSENRNPSPETQEQINEGVNFVYNWLTERYNAGKMSENEYSSAVDKIRNTKIFPTDRGTDRLIDAYENGELNLKWDLVMGGADVSSLKKALLNQSSHADDMFGLSTYWADNPAILINIDKIKAESEGRADLSSVVAHEITHCLELKDTSERAIEDALYGASRHKAENLPSSTKSAQNISVQIIPDNSTEKYAHNENNGQIIRSGKKPRAMLLNDGVIYDPYLDKQSEIYARIMEMRFNMKLDPQKIYSPEDVEQIRKDLLKKRLEGKLNGADSEINSRIFERYSNEQISHFLNDTAHTRDIKKTMSDDFMHYSEMYASLDKMQEHKQLPQQQKNDLSLSSAILKKQHEYS